MRFSLLLAGLMVGSAVLSAGAEAQGKPKLLGSYRDWDAMVGTMPDGSKTCYMISTPKRSTANKKNVNRGQIYMTVTHRPKFGVKGEVNAVVGYPIRSGSEAKISVDGRHNFSFFTEGSGAWAYDPKDDAAAVSAMKAGSNLVVKASSSRGTDTTDTYSLSGFTAAYNAISKACY
ncbi:invasion associated locus B family protein [Kordiimonas gwangyangensis]|uniref:invasion associated locus B family protein n=1 Tax=Kordiimonas gwangyangensis TaxID=288022 RepID=UPI00047681CD|nr:invasion associated locus B family protein [Kordiimonas gwangyangensis]